MPGIAVGRLQREVEVREGRGVDRQWKAQRGGGIALTKGVTLTDFEIGIDATPGRRHHRLPILSVDLSALKSDVSGGAITLTGAALKLTATAAGALNQAFGATAFTEGLLLGTATVRASPARSADRERRTPTAPRRSSSTRAPWPRSPASASRPPRSRRRARCPPASSRSRSSTRRSPRC